MRFKTIKWVCNNCRWTWETLTTVVEDEVVEDQCPECRSFETKEVIGNPASILKGSGFYKTDYCIKT